MKILSSPPPCPELASTLGGDVPVLSSIDVAAKRRSPDERHPGKVSRSMSKLPSHVALQFLPPTSPGVERPAATFAPNFSPNASFQVTRVSPQTAKCLSFTHFFRLVSWCAAKRKSKAQPGAEPGAERGAKSGLKCLSGDEISLELCDWGLEQLGELCVWGVVWPRSRVGSGHVFKARDARQEMVKFRTGWTRAEFCCHLINEPWRTIKNCELISKYFSDMLVWSWCTFPNLAYEFLKIVGLDRNTLMTFIHFVSWNVHSFIDI